MKAWKSLAALAALLFVGCMNQVRTRTYVANPPKVDVSMGGPYEDTLVLAHDVIGRRVITFTSPLYWKGEVWFTQVGSAANVQWRQLARFPQLDDHDRLGWSYEYQVVPQYIGTTKLEMEPDGYRLGMSHVTIHVIGPIKTF